ncbi:hypothetical protein OTU49_008663 [Cherax quadricarinatus]|uniref:Swi5-dependent recombination DNA repair protein 1 homolog n=1 Tax=Cherax quadricarinatus TaxID=27406 RepID=A0AAW0WP07_CHEQU
MPPEKSTSDQASEQEEDDESDNMEPKFKVPRKNPGEYDDLHCQIQQTRARVKEKEENLRKLKLVKMYRTKWETQSLEEVTHQWLRVCQEALEELRDKVNNRNTGEEVLTLQALVNKLGIDAHLIKLNEHDDCFNK